MSHQELYDIYRDAKHRMMESRDKVERAIWMNMFRWAVSEIRRTAAMRVATAREQN